MLVDIHVSSMKTSFSASLVGSACCQAWRARCTSSRSCSLARRVFFKGQIPFVQLVPQGTDLDRYAPLGETSSHLGQAQPRRLFDPGAQHGLHLRDPRTAMATDLKTGALAGLLLPPPHLINPDAT